MQFFDRRQISVGCVTSNEMSLFYESISYKHLIHFEPMAQMFV